MEVDDLTDSILTCCHSNITVSDLRTVLCTSAEAHSGPSQTLKIDVFARKIKGKLMQI